MLYLGKQAESYKVIIYAPPCLEMTVAEGVVDRNLVTPPRVSAEHTRRKNWKGNQRRCIYYYEAITTGKDQEDNMRRGTTIRIYRRERLLTG